MMVYITGKPMPRIKGIEMNPIYRAAYRACINAGKNRTKATAREYDKLVKAGIDDPAKTKLIMRTAKKDYKNDITTLSGGDFSQILQRRINTLKTNIELKLFNGNYRKNNKMLNNALKEQHPQSYKLRKKALEKADSAIVNETTPFARLGRLNINPINL